jgi:sigma-B regulation protein RsbU (phosphoserine phosphatase)
MFALILPAWITIVQARRGSEDSRLFLTRLRLDQKAQEVIDQESRVTSQWAERLVPALMDDSEDLEFGRSSHAGAGVVTGDFLDVVPLGFGRTAVVIGDATGHGLEASISAFQSKYVLRSFLRRFRDPAQVLEELNAHLGASAGPEDLLSVLVAVVDTSVGTVRYASAGHCTNLAVIERELVPLRATGPLLMLDREAHYNARELSFGTEDVVLLFTDGLAEARTGNGAQFGTERIGYQLRKESNAAAEVLAKSLLDAAVDHASGHLDDDLTVLAVRRK